MKKIIFFVLSFSLAVFGDFLLGGRVFFNIIPPLTICMICYWFWHLSFGWRMGLAFAGGLIMDTIHFFPLGANLLMLVLLVFASEWMRSFFSNTKSRFVTGLGVAILLILFRFLISPIGMFTSSLSL